MIEHRSNFEGFINGLGVGSKDKVADSVSSYESYPESVSRHLNVIVGPKTLGLNGDLEYLSSMLRKTGKVSEKTVKNYRSAMRHYFDMVASMN